MTGIVAVISALLTFCAIHVKFSWSARLPISVRIAHRFRQLGR